MKKLINLILSIFIGVFAFSAVTATPVFAADDSICNNSNISQEIKDAAGCTNSKNDKLPKVVTNIINSVIGILSLVAVVFIIVGGVTYITSSGDPSKTKKAKDTILYACIGLIIAGLAYAIVNFTISALSEPKPEEESLLIESTYC